MKYKLIRHDSLHQIVADGRQGSRSVHQLLKDVGKLVHVLQSIESVKQVLLVFEEDAYLQLISIFASWVHHIEPIIPGDTRRSTLSRLIELDEVGAVLHDTNSGLSYKVQEALDTCHAEVDTESICAQLEAVWDSKDAGVIFSERNEDGCIVDKRVSTRELRTELHRLQKSASYTPGSSVGRTLSLSHRYSWVWSVLKPFVDGAVFVREPYHVVNSICEDTKDVFFDILVTAPPHLQCLALLSKKPLSETLVSLAGVSKASIGDLHFGSYIEVLVSNETGSLAVASQPGQSFQPLSGVVASSGTCLHWSIDEQPVRSQLGMQGEVHTDGTISYTGQHDRVVYINDNQLVLDQMAQKLAHKWRVVDVGIDAYLTNPRGPLLLVAVKIGTSSLVEPVQILSGQDFEGQCCSDIRAFVRDAEICFMVLPEVPRFPMGSLNRKSMRALAGIDEQGNTSPSELALCAREATEKTYNFEAVVPSDYRWFEGHFEGYPVLPAAIQIETMVVASLQKLALISMDACLQFERMKFLRRIEPGDTLNISIQPHDNGGINFSLYSKGEVCTTGRVRERA